MIYMQHGDGARGYLLRAFGYHFLYDRNFVFAAGHHCMQEEGRWVTHSLYIVRNPHLVGDGMESVVETPINIRS